MKKLLGKIGTKLALKYGKPDLVELTLKQLEIFNDPINWDDLDDAQKYNFCGACEELLMPDSTLLKVIGELAALAKDRMIHRAQDESFYLDRITISTLERLVERLHEYASAKSGEVKFDKFKIV